MQFNRSTTSDKQGEGAYGEAKHVIAQAFNRIAKKKFGNREIKLNIQYNKKDGTAIEDPIIRVNVDYGECKPESRAKIDIFDLKSQKINGTYPILNCTYGWVYDAIPFGSLCTGIDDMSYVVSGESVSNPSKAAVLYVKSSASKYNFTDCI